MRDSTPNYDIASMSSMEKDALITTLLAQLAVIQNGESAPVFSENTTRLSDHDLRQLDRERLCMLGLSALQRVAIRLLDDLKAARDRLRQTPENSSRPPSSRAPWERVSATPDDGSSRPDIAVGDHANHAESPLGEITMPSADTNDAAPKVSAAPATQPKKNPGKQPGAKGVGRTQKLEVDVTVRHCPEQCALCAAPLASESAIPYTGRNEIDIAGCIEGRAGLNLIVTRHQLCETICACGHVTRATHHVSPNDPLWENVEQGEWRLIGPRLAGVIVLLAMRMRLSRNSIREFFDVLLNLQLSKGVIDETIREAGRCCAPLEDELVEDIQQDTVLYLDETSWKEAGKDLWLWVFATRYALLYCIGFRSMETLENVLPGDYPGLVMSDGYRAYRHLKNRLRCWAHLLRKLRGLAESTDARVAGAGQAMLGIMQALMDAIYKARLRQKGSDAGLASQYAPNIDQLKALCEKHQHDVHPKLGEVAREFLLDWEVIIRQVSEPDLPLTNNEAERALRHWVIARRINYGTRSEAGTRAYAILASVVDTCRARAASSWEYIATVIAAARVGEKVPPLPPVPVGE